jgi:hypothetical protein
VIVATSETVTVLFSIVGIIGATLVIAIARSAMKLFQSSQTKRRDDVSDQRENREFFFDTPANPRTGTPAKQGWTTKVDLTLQELQQGQIRTTSLVNEVLRELKPDGNGGHNLRGLVERSVEAAGVETTSQVIERTRVQARDKAADS